MIADNDKLLVRIEFEQKVRDNGGDKIKTVALLLRGIAARLDQNEITSEIIRIYAEALEQQ